jgi:hypothetical protein
VDVFRGEGLLRINPLHVYRSMAGKPRDASEGIKPTRIFGVGTLTREQSKAILGVDNWITFGRGGSLIHNLHLPIGYLISTSTEYKKALFARFGADGCFGIKDPGAFSAEVEKAIEAVVPVSKSIEGLVLYVEERELGLNVQNLVRLGPRFRDFGEAHYFVKPRTPYEVESEYRFVFLVGTGAALSPIDARLSADLISECCEFDLSTPTV